MGIVEDQKKLDLNKLHVKYKIFPDLICTKKPQSEHKSERS
jgi:hypothetical protein